MPINIQIQLAVSQDIKLMFCVVLHTMMDWNGFCWCYARDKGWRHHIGFGAGRAFRIKHEVKTPISFALAMLLLCGDICPNPRPRNIRYAEYVRKQSKVTNKESVVTFVKYGFIQEAPLICKGMTLS